MSSLESAWAHAVEALKGASSVALGCHVDPDGDAIGSMLALRSVLVERGVRVSAGWAGDRDGLLVPPPYSFLPDVGRLTGPPGFEPAPEVFVALDCAAAERLGALQPIAEQAGTVIVIDHHAAGAAFGDVRLVDPEATATAELVAEIIDRLGVELDRDLATCLYVGLVTDSGRFTYSSVGPETMRLGARLLETGIDHAWINQQVWETHSFGYLKVLAFALERATLVPSAGFVWTAITQDDLASFGVTLAETEGLIDVLRTIESAESAMVCKEQDDGSWRVSLRSKGAVNVGEVAQEFGGGGHAFAAGFVADGPLGETVEGVRRILTEKGDG